MKQPKMDKCMKTKEETSKDCSGRGNKQERSLQVKRRTEARQEPPNIQQLNIQQPNIQQPNIQQPKEEVSKQLPDAAAWE